MGTPTQSPDLMRIKFGYNLIVTALIVVVVLFAGLVALYLFRGTADTNIVTAFTSATTVIGTLVGAFFGYQQGAAGKEKAEERAENAQKEARALYQVTSPEVIDKAKQLYPDVFK